MLITSVVILAGVLTAGLVGLLADPLHLPLPLLSVLDQRANVISMFIGAAGLMISVVALFHRPKDEEPFLHGGVHFHGLHSAVGIGALPTAVHRSAGTSDAVEEYVRRGGRQVRTGLSGLLDGRGRLPGSALRVEGDHQGRPTEPLCWCRLRRGGSPG